MNKNENTIFKLHQLTDFEKILFLQKQVKELIKISRNRGELIHVLKNRIEELEDINSGSGSSRRIKHLEGENKNLKRNLQNEKSRFHRLTYKHNELFKDKTELETIEFYSVEGKDKGNIFGTAEGEFWIHRGMHVIDSNNNEMTTLKWILNKKLKR